MRAAFTWIVIVCLTTCFSISVWGQENADWVWETSQIELEDTGQTPRNGMLIGHHNGVDILAGGTTTDSSNQIHFADSFALFRKNIYHDCYIRKHGSKKWEKQADLPKELLGSTFIVTKDGLLCFANKQPIWLYWNKREQKIEQHKGLLPKHFKLREHNRQLFYTDKKVYRHPSGSTQHINTGFPTDSSNYILSNLITGQEVGVNKIPYNIESVNHGAIQGNGLHNCVYHIEKGLSGLEATLWEHNLFTGQRRKIPGPNSTSTFNSHVISFPLGSAHQLFIGLGENKNEVWSYYTITKAWHPVDTLDIVPFTNNEKFFSDQSGVRFPATNKKGELVFTEGYIPSQQQTFGTLNYVVLGLYFLILILMGVYFSRRQKSTEDYFKGGGRIPWWAAGISIFGTALSAISFMAIPAKTFATDWAYLFNNLGPLYVAPIIALFFVPFFIRLDLNTAYEYLEKRFNLATRVLGSLSFIIYQIGRIGIVLYLPAIALNVVTGLDILFCIVLMGILSIIYTMMGGIEGVIWTDVLQVIILMGGGFLCLVFLIMSTEGGWSTWWQSAAVNNKFNIWDVRIDWQHPTLIVVLIGGFFSNLVSYSTDQTFVQRYLTATDVGKAQKSVYTNALLMLPATLLFFAIGTALYVFYQQYPYELQTGLSSTDAIFPYFILSQLPQGVSGLLIAGVFAAAMSTLSSSMNSVASAYSNDFHARFGWSGSPMKVARWSTLVTGLVGTLFAMLMATSDIKSVWDEFLKIIGLITGGLGGVFVLGMVSKKANGTGALIGLLGSAIIQYWLGVTKPIHLLLFTATGFISALGIGWVASLLFKKK